MTERIAIPANASRPGRTLLRWLRPFRLRILLSMLVFGIKDSPQWVLPIITASVIDVVVSHGHPQQLLWLLAGGLIILVQNFPTNIVFVTLYMGSVRQLAVDIRNRVTHQLQELTIGYHARASSSIIQTKIIRDVENIELMMQQSAQTGFSAFFVLAGAIVVTALRVPAFVPVFFLAVPVAALLVRGLRRRSNSRNEQFRHMVEHLSARVGEMSTLMPITRAHGLESDAADRVGRSAEGVRDAGLKLDRLNGSFGALSWISYQSLGVLCLSAAALAALTGFIPITPGEVVLLSTYFTILTGSVVSVLSLAPIVTRGIESVKSICEVLEEPDIEANNGKAVVSSLDGDLRLENVGFEHSDGVRPVLSGIDLHIRRGETVAFVGPSGSGKSTLLNLVLGFLRPTEGRILFDGQDMAELDMRTLRAFVAVVPQESVLFEGTVRENVTHGLARTTDDEVRQALSDANALDIIADLPEGWHTLVGERGARLSGGQRQRFAIARALIRDPRILLLDEATSALDSESERLVQQALHKLIGGRTTLIVAHRLSTIRSADRIVVLDNGRIAEMGSHDSLMAAAGRYRQLVIAQNP